MYSSLRLSTPSLVFSTMAILLFAIHAPVHAQVRGGADIQLGQSDRTLTDTRSVEAAAGSQVVIDVFGSGYAGSFGMEAIFQLSDPAAVAAAEGATTGIFPITFSSTVKDNNVSLTLGALATVSESGDGLKYIGSLTLTMGPAFSTLEITFIKISFGAGLETNPNIVLTVTNPEGPGLPKTVAADLNPRPGNQNKLQARVNPGRAFPLQVFAGNLKKTTGFEIHLESDRDISDPSQIRFQAQNPFVVTTGSSGGPSDLPAPTASTIERAGADIQLGSGDGNYDASALSVAGTPGATVVVEVYGSGYQEKNGFTATFQVTNPSAIQSLDSSPGAFPLKLSSPKLEQNIEGNTITFNMASLSPLTDSGGGLKLLGTMTITLASDLGDGLGLTLSALSFDSAASQDETTPGAVLTVSSGAAPSGAPTPAGSSVTIEGRTIIAKAIAPGEGVTGNSRLGQFAIFVGSSFRGGELTLSKVIFTSGEQSETVEPGIVLKLGSVLTDAPVISDVTATASDTRAVIKWTTPNKESSGIVVYGTDRGNLNQQTSGTSDSSKKRHSALIENLERGVRVFYQIVATDEGGNSSDPFPPRPFFFVTRKRPDNLLPRILAGPFTLGLKTDGFTVFLTTDEAVNVDVLHGASEDALDQTATTPTPNSRSHHVSLTGLTGGTHFFQARLTDLNGNIFETPVKSVFIPSVIDVVAPRLLGRPSTFRAFNRVDLEVNLSEASAVALFFSTNKTTIEQIASSGTTKLALQNGEADLDLVTVNTLKDKQRISMANLLASTIYYGIIRMTDATGNVGFSNLFTFSTGEDEDTTAPRVGLPRVSTRNTEARISWKISEPATVEVQFDTTIAVLEDESGTVGEIVSLPDPIRNAVVALTNLTPLRKYYFQAFSTDLSGNGPTTFTGEFVTKFKADTEPPRVLGLPIGDARGVITWGATEDHSFVIRYRRIGAGKQTDEFTDTFVGTNVASNHAVPLSLEPGTYQFEVETTDLEGNIGISSSSEMRFTIPGADTNKPRIFRPLVRNFTPTSFTVEWKTNERSDSKAGIGLTTDYEIVTFDDPDLVLDHSITFSELTSGTLYHFFVGSADLQGNLATTTAAGTELGVSADYTFRTPTLEGLNQPIIDEIIVDIKDQLAIFQWTTDQTATSKVVIGVPAGSAQAAVEGTPVFGELSQIVVEGNTLVTNHSVAVPDLEPGVGYVFQLFSTSGAGLTGNSPSPSTSGVATKLQPPGGLGSFTTSTESDSQFPVITSGPTVIASTSSSLTVQWETDENSNSVVDFGASQEGGAAKQAVSLTAQEVSGASLTNHTVVLTNLNSGTTYAYEAASTDAVGNGAARSKVAYGTTLSDVDLTAPGIQGAPEVIYKNDRSATIRWVTTEAADAEVAFGTSQDSLLNIRTMPDIETEHTVTLTNLSNSTTYFFQVSSTDQNNNGPTKSSILSFDTDALPDTQDPTITDLAVAVSDSSALVTWKTNELSDSAVQFGTASGSLGLNLGDATDIIDHSVTLTNLQPNVQYFYIVESIDKSGNGPVESAEATFTTLATDAVQAPDAPSGLVASGGNAAVRLSWSVSPSAGVIGYTVERAEGEGAFSPLASIDAVTSYVDNNVQNGTAYRYQVKTVGLKQLTGTASTPTDAVTPTAESGPSAPTLFAIQGTQTAPTLVINNSTPLNPDDPLFYTFHIATSSDFSDAVTVAAGIVSGAGLAASDPTGITAWIVDRTLTDGTTYHYRVKAFDGAFDSAFLTGSFTVNASAPAFPGDFDGDRTVNFSDFLGLINTFNKTTGQDGFNPDADFNNDGSVNFADFVAFIKVFNKKYITGTSGSSKPVTPIAYGIDPAVRFQLVRQPSASAQDGQEIVVDVTVSDVENLKGYGVRLTYDPASLQFLDVASSEEALLKTEGRLAELFGVLENNPETGEVFIASAVTQGEPVQGQGTLFSLRFRLLDPKPRGELIGIAEGLLIDDLLAINTAQNLGSRLALLPTDYVLEHNFPNPFNPDTTIRYAVPEAGKITLTVYNVLGQEVVTLVNTHHLAGYYTLQWNGQDRFGRGVASGIYLYHMTAGEFVKTHKMLLLK